MYNAHFGHFKPTLKATNSFFRVLYCLSGQYNTFKGLSFLPQCYST